MYPQICNITTSAHNPEGAQHCCALEERAYMEIEHLQQFSDTLTILPIRRVAQGARRRRSVDRNSFRSPRGACDSRSVQHRPPGSTSVRTAIIPRQSSVSSSHASQALSLHGRYNRTGRHTQECSFCRFFCRCCFSFQELPTSSRGCKCIGSHNRCATPQRLPKRQSWMSGRMRVSKASHILSPGN